MTIVAVTTAGAIAVIAMWLALIAEIDRRCTRIPNRLVIPGVLAVAASGCVHPLVGAAAVTAAVAYLLGFAVGACGAGDVKLAFVLGGLLGHPVLALAAVLLAQVIALGGFALRRCGRPRPHAPALVGAFLLTAAVIVLVGAWNN